MVGFLVITYKKYCDNLNKKDIEKTEPMCYNGVTICSCLHLWEIMQRQIVAVQGR